jgi:hypothetical protein
MAACAAQAGCLGSTILHAIPYYVPAGLASPNEHEPVCDIAAKHCK